MTLMMSARRARRSVATLVTVLVFGALQAMPAEAGPAPVADRALPTMGAPVAAVAGDKDVSRAALGATTGPAGYDFATSTFGDPWDYSNQDDLILNFSGAQKFAGLTMSHSLIQGRTTGNSAYLSPVWGGYSDSLLNGREGGLTRNKIDAGRYNALVVQMWSNASVAADSNFYGVWYRCANIVPQNSCGGRTPFTYLHRGWNTYVIPLGDSAPGYPLDWEGAINGFRLVFNAGVSDVKIDWMRLTRIGTATKVAVPSTANVDLVWDRNSSDADNTAYTGGGDPSPGTGAQTWGYVRAGSPGRSSVLSAGKADLSFLPPGSYRIGTRPSSGGKTTWLRQVTLVAQRPRLITPNELGSTDFATAVLGNPWDMNSAGDVATRTNAAVSVSGGAANGRNAAPNYRDPWITFPTGKGVTGAAYNILSIRTSYSGASSVGAGPGQGTVARLMWRRADHDSSAQTVTSKPIPTYPGTRTFTVDLSRSDAEIIQSAGKRPSWRFDGPRPVTQVRWDPNEDPANGSNGASPRKWRITDVQLRRHFGADGSFPITWTDDAYEAGSRATVVIGRSANSCSGTTIASNVLVRPGVNTTIWNTRDTAPGSLWVCLKISRSGSTVSTLARGSITVAHESGRPAAPLRPKFLISKRNGGKIDVSFGSGSGPIKGYEVEDVANGSHTVLPAAVRSTFVVCPTAAKHVQVRVRSFGPGGVSAWTALGTDHGSC